MSELNYIGAGELVFNNDMKEGIHSGGFSVNSIMLKNGMSPIMTFNTEQTGGKLDKVSDLFNDLVVPNWALSYNNTFTSGGKYKEVQHNDTDSDDDVVHDDLHDKLLELVKEYNIQSKSIKKRMTKKNKISSKKGRTKRIK